MQEDKLLTFIEESFHPDPYPDIAEGCPETKTLLLLKYKKSARYTLAVAPWENTTSPKTQLNQIRSGVRNALGASFPFRNVGVIVFWYGPEDSWRSAIEDIAPDKHGVRSTIVQGIVFLDPETGSSEILQSNWGPITFGDWQGQFSRIREFCSRHQTYNQALQPTAKGGT